MIKRFNYDRAFFQSIRDRNITINGSDLDLQFNNIISYLNKKILPQLDSLKHNIGTSDAGTKNALLRNTGDKTKWDYISNNDIGSNIISFDKITAAGLGTILASDAAGIFGNITPSAGNLILSSRTGKSPDWLYVRGVHFANNSINTNKISQKTLDARHLAESFTGNITPSLIKTNTIQSGTISEIKIANNAFTNECISDELMNIIKRDKIKTFEAKAITTRMIPDNSVELITIVDKFVQHVKKQDGLYSTHNERLIFDIPVNQVILANGTINPRMHLSGCIYPEHIKDQSYAINKYGMNGDISYQKKCKISKQKLSLALRTKLGL